jgi:hypothetical protein
VVVCVNGAEPKPAAPPFEQVTGSLLASRLPGWLRWFAPFIELAAPFVVETTDLCSADPPEFPVWTGAELATLLTPLYSADYSSAVAKLRDSVLHVLWYEYCQCQSGEPTPAMPVVVPPTPLPVITEAPGIPCDRFYDEFSTSGYLFGATVADPPNAALMSGGRPLPPGPTKVRLTFACITKPAQALTWSWAAIFAGADNRVISAIGNDLAPSAAGAFEVTDGNIPAGATQWVAQITTGGTPTAGWNNSLDVQMFCGASSPGTTGRDCCPPDPDVVRRLARIEALLTLVQRQGVPFAYVPGLEYPGLTGNGEVTFSDPIVRAKVELTTLPGWYGLAEGHPDAIFDVGYVALGTADGFERSRPIAHSPMLLQVAGDVTKIGYSLSPGVVGKITTYSREP